MKLGFENRKKAIWAAVLGGLAILAMAYEVIPFFAGGPATTATGTAGPAVAPLHPTNAVRSKAKSGGKKVRGEPSLDPTLQLKLLETTEQIKYAGSGRNIFVSQAEPPPTPIAPAVTDKMKAEQATYVAPPPPPPPPIPLKFFGFASGPGEPKKAFLSQGDDVFIAGEGEIIDRRYKVVRISATSIEMQDVVNSGPPQSIPLTQG